MLGYQRLSNGENGSWQGVIRLSQPVLLDPLRKPEMYVSSNLEEPDGAWWLRQHWRSLQASTP